MTLDDVPIAVAAVAEPSSPYNQAPVDPSHSVELRVRGFSCNYRDKALILRAASEGSSHVLGSEFVADVVCVGPAVASVAVGDRVIPNCSYPESGIADVAPGVPTNHASFERLVLHEAKLLKVPSRMPDAIAASFSIGAQTAYGMVRRLGVTSEDVVLVTAARSNTALFVIQALRRTSAKVFAVTSNSQIATRVRSLGVNDVVEVEHGHSLLSHPKLHRFASRRGFDIAIDPLYDAHLCDASELLAVGGRYVTCGMLRQGLAAPAYHDDPAKVRELGFRAIAKNLTFIGNCLGNTEDLQSALKDYQSGRIDVLMDSTYTDGEEGAFLRRTYCAPDRFGKVAYLYN